MIAATERLPFQLPDFTRVSWVSERARGVWQPRIAKVRDAWLDTERRSVAAGLRRCALQHGDVHDLPRLAAAAAEHGLTALPLVREGARDITYRVAIARPHDALAFRSAWRDGDDTAMGTLLGYPACCVEFFRRTWVDESATDTTWAMATGSDRTAAATVEIDGAPESNILWRWLGVRAVPHLPCSARCEETRRLANAMLDVARSAGLTQEAAWLLDILSWPVEWSALHGIAEIKTPVLKIAARSDATARRRVVRRHGSGYPAEGARGVAFPYRRQAPAAAEHVSIHVASSARRASSTVESHWAANGFPTEAAMREAHAPIVKIAAGVLGGRRATVLDLGCGNGALLRAIAEGRPHTSVVGVDCDDARVAHARRVLAALPHALFAGDMFDDNGAWRALRPDLILLMPGRLLEATSERATRLRQWLRAQDAAIVAYAYSDWIADQASLAHLCQRAGLETAAASGVSAALAVVATTG